MSSSILRIADYLFVTRPLILVPAWSFYLLGTRAGALSPNALVTPRVHLIALGCLSAVLASGYLLNQIFDRETDARNDKGHFLTRGIFGVRTVIIMSMILFVAGAALFQEVPTRQQPWLIAALVLSLIYSLPPLRLCSRPWLDLLANAIGYGGVAFILGASAMGNLPVHHAIRALPWVLLVAAVFLHTTILDVDGDRAAGKRSTSVQIGVGPSALLAVLFSAAALGWSLAVSWKVDGDGIVPAVCGAGLAGTFVAYVRIRRALTTAPAPTTAPALTATPPHTAAPYPDGPPDPHALEVRAASASIVQGLTGIVAVAAAIVEPYFLGVVVPLVILSRLYYKARFHLSYPGVPAGSTDASEAASTPPPR